MELHMTGKTALVTGASEGIGKAMESGLLAAELALDARGEMASIGPAYATEMRSRYAARFRTYDIAQRWVAYVLSPAGQATLAAQGFLVKK